LGFLDGETASVPQIPRFRNEFLQKLNIDYGVRYLALVDLTASSWPGLSRPSTLGALKTAVFPYLAEGPANAAPDRPSMELSSIGFIRNRRPEFIRGQAVVISELKFRGIEREQFFADLRSLLSLWRATGAPNRVGGRDKPGHDSALGGRRLTNGNLKSLAAAVSVRLTRTR
jgi:hypothetical protein